MPESKVEKLRLLLNGEENPKDLEQCRSPRTSHSLYSPRTPRTPGFIGYAPPPTSQRWVWIGLLLASLANAGCLFLSYTLYSHSHLDTSHYNASSAALTGEFWAPDVAAVSGFAAVTLNNSEQLMNKYMGDPSQELDDEWYKLWKVPHGRMTKEEVIRVGKNPDLIAQWPERHGGGYIFGAEAFHQLHCLDLIRRATWYPAHYTNDPFFIKHTPQQVRQHLDHCIETLRQTIVCNAETSPKPFVWVHGHNKPVPDDVLNKQCRSFDAVLAWGHARAMPPQAQDDVINGDESQWRGKVWSWPP